MRAASSDKPGSRQTKQVLGMHRASPQADQSVLAKHDLCLKATMATRTEVLWAC